MIQKSILYKKQIRKQIVKKKMKSIIFYGIIFLISTIAYYFVNTSKAQNVLKLETFVIDKEAIIEPTSYEAKAQENEEVYKIKLPSIQNGFVVKKYYLISKEEYNILNKDKEDKKIADIITETNNQKETTVANEVTKDEKIKENVTEKEKNQNTVSENTVSENANVKNADNKNTSVENVISQNVINENSKTTNENEEAKKEDNVEEKETKKEIEKKKEDIVILPETEFKLNSEEVENKALYLVAEYDKKEVKEKDIYNRIISTKTEKNAIIISGYMPLNAKIKATEVDVKEVEGKIKDKTENNVKLKVAYDIKIVDDDIEYEPNEFDENVKVKITALDDENINIWHIKEDDNIEKMQAEKIGKNIQFDAKHFSIYGVEVVDEQENVDDKKDDKTDNEILNEITNEKTNEILEDKNVEKTGEEVVKVTKKGGPLRAPASNLPDTILEINDYTSDYNYYMGKNYTDNIAGTNSNTYSSSNLVRVTVNYYGFANGETDSEKKGRISLTETDDIVKNIRCLPIVNGNVEIELMDNPFMDKPTGYGFGGWTSTAGEITTDSNTKVQTLTVQASGEITVNVYANWMQATVVYVNQETGADDVDTGLTEDSPFGSWGKACQYLLQHSTNVNNRELNIIVLTGPIDTSINSTKSTYDTSGYQYVYYDQDSITSGDTYLLANGTSTSNYAIYADGEYSGRVQLSSTTEPSSNARWIIERSGTGYTIKNVSTNQYLYIYYSRWSYPQYSLRLKNSATVWNYNNGIFSTTANNRTCYIYYNSGWSTTTTQSSASTIYLLKYQYEYKKSAEIDSRESNSYYSSSNNLALTVTSLYNHTDYREDAIIDLTGSYNDFTIYNDFQMNHVKINATGYTSNSSGTSFSSPLLTGRTNNVRIGRGVQCDDTTSSGCTFANIIGGGVSNTSSDAAYKLVVESGKYSSIQGFNPNNDDNDYYGTVYLTLGSDIDRKNSNNSDLSTYYRTTINSGDGVNGTSTNEKAFLINVKSGQFGVDFFEANKNSTNTTTKQNIAYSGIYIGGYGASSSDSTRDRADRYMIVEGGLISNIIGGLKTTSGSDVETRIYVKGGEAYNIVGGAGRSTTYEDRIIQVTGGTIRYSVTGGSNGVYSSTTAGDNGRIENCDTLVYIGGNAKIGIDTTLNTSLYEVEAGCVLGAGNGKSDVPVSGQVDNTHIIINDSAHILNNVYGGGNYGLVGTSGSTSATTRVEILGGTIDNNVYGGANQNDINGSTTVNVKGGQVKGAVYGGSNDDGTIASTATVNITGGTLGTSGNTNPVLFGGGRGNDTVVNGGTTVNISDTDGNTTLYGNAYGGSAEGKIGEVRVTYSVASTITSGEQYIIANGTGQGSRALVMPQTGTTFTSATLDGSEPTDYMLWIPTGSNPYTIRNVARDTYYIRYSSGLAASTTSASWTYNNNKLYSNNRYLRYNNGWTTSTNSGSNGTNIYFLKCVPDVGNAGTHVKISHDTSHSNNISITGNVFAGGQGTASHSALIGGNSLIEVDGASLPNASIFGGNDINGVTSGSITVNIGENYASTVANVYGGGNEDDTGTEASSVKVYLLSHANVTNAFNGGKSADLTTAGTNDTTRAIYLRGGSATNIFGGSDTLGTVTASHVYIESGNATNVYGGNNRGGQTTQSFVYMQGGNATNVYGGGYLATTPTTNVSLTGGTITNGFGGGNSANVTTSNITLNGTTSTNIYGGSNEAGTVSNSNVTITSGTVTDVFGGNNAGGDTVNTNVVVTSRAVNVYGGGNEAITTGNTNVNINNATIVKKEVIIEGETKQVGGNVFGGGNGVAAVVQGNSTTIVQGTSAIANDVFGGGNAAPNGTEQNPNSTVRTYITGGRIEGDVYGAANTSVVYGQTQVKIGADAVNNNAYTKNNIYIGGTVFGGGKSNTAGSDSYDFDFESVTGDANIDIDANGYDNGTYTFTIGKSVFGSGNAAKISGNGYVNISNYGSSSNLKENISIQRATQVVFNNCNIYLRGTTDTTNEIATAVYTFNRIDDIVVKNSTTLYMESGVNIVSKFESLDASGNKAQVRITNGQVTKTNNNDNRIFLLEGKNMILRTEEGNHGEVYGMTYVGIYKGTTTRIKGIYDIDTYSNGTTIPSEIKEIFERNSYVQGKHYSSHNIEEDGFYTNYDNNGTINTKYIEPTPEDAAYYQWIVGKVTTDIYYEDIELIGTKYATTGAHVLTLAGLSYPNTTIKVVGFDTSDLKTGITFNEPNTIPNIAATGADADTKFGLTMTAGNSGWQTKGTTNFLDNSSAQETYSGTTQYLSDNSNTTPTFSFYLAHSKNISSTEVLGTVKISLEVNYVENEVMQIRNAYIILKLSLNNTLKMDKDYYEGAITPGKQYSMFPTTTTTITKKSSFSAYYSLFLNDYSHTKYYEGFAGKYYHVFISSCVLPANTKITLIDKSQSTVRYYYYIVTSQDMAGGKTVYRFTDFKAMDSTDEPYSNDGIYYNSSTDLLYEEFIVHVDFEDITLAESMVGQNLLVQLRDAFDDVPTITVNTAQYPMLFSVYNNLEATATISLTADKNVIHMGDVVNMNIETEYTFSKNENLDVVYDTTNIDNQLGVRITVSSGSKLMTATDLEGIYIKYKNSNYYARSDGSYRIKIADAVANVLADMELHTEVGKLETGAYTIKAESFGSSDGTYFSTAIAQDTVELQIVSSKYGFDVSLDDNSVLIDKTTGKNKNDTNNLNFTIGYSGNFSNPKITVTLYRRKYDQIYSYEYEQVDLGDYVTNALTSTTHTNEYLVTSSAQASQNFTLTTKNNLTTGTYKIRFSLYDGNVLIADMDKAVIIK